MGHGVGLLLLAAVGGYWVLERAATHKGGLKRAGQLVGSVIIAVSLIGVVCHVWYLVVGARGFCSMGKTGKGVYCPYTPEMSPPASSK